MKAQKLKIYSIVLGSLLIFSAAAYKLIACSDGGEEEYELYGFFNPDQDTSQVDRPLFVSWLSYNGYNYYNQSTCTTCLPTEERLNAREWSQYLGNKLSVDDMEVMLHAYSFTYDSLRQYFDKKSPLPKNKQLQGVIGRLQALPQKAAVLQYINFARDVEKVCNRQPWDDEGYDDEFVTKHTAQAIGQVRTSTEAFLKLRWAFQVQRLLFQKGNHEGSKNWYTKIIEPLKPTGIMKFRTFGYYAGSHFNLNRRAESNYYFSLIYDKYPQGRQRAYESFHPWDQQDWDSCLTLAKNTREKEVLWQLFGIYADPLLAMRKIYALNPQSDQLQLLLIRSVAIVELHALPQTANDSINKAQNRENSSLVDSTTHSSARSFNTFARNVQQERLQLFVDSCANNNNTANICLWHNAAAYLSLTVGNAKACKQHLAKIDDYATATTTDKAQAATTRALMNTLALQEIGKRDEKLIFESLSKMTVKNYKERSAYDFILTYLSHIYKAQKDDIKAELCNRGYDNKPFYNTKTQVDRMLSFMRRKDLSECEQLYLKAYPIKDSDLVDLQAIDYLYDGAFDKAIAKFEETPRKAQYVLQANPFNIHLVDCHDCDIAAKQKTRLSRPEFVKKLREMLQKAETETDSTIRAQNYFLLANGLYNITYYGNNRPVHSTVLEGIQSVWNKEGEEYSQDKRFYDCAPALRYYEKALSLSPSFEFRAKCAWMCAKCEHAMNYEKRLIPIYGSPNSPNMDFIAGSYFNLIKQQYADSKYYNEILKECGYFCTYMGGGGDCIRNRDY